MSVRADDAADVALESLETLERTLAALQQLAADNHAGLTTEEAPEVYQPKLLCVRACVHVCVCVHVLGHEHMDMEAITAFRKHSATHFVQPRPSLSLSLTANSHSYVNLPSEGGRSWRFSSAAPEVHQ